jgi:predicted nucleic acid-binding protein
MNGADCVIIDANIAFKCLISARGDLRQRLDPSGHLQFFTPRFLFVELFKHKGRLVSASGLPESDLLAALHTLLSRVEFVNEENVPLGTWMEAYRLCKGIDEKDTPYVALTLHLEGQLWTEDDVLKSALKARGFTQFFAP